MLLEDDTLYPWQTCGQPKFDEAVEMLLVARHQADPSQGVATAIDGRGGDEGIDVDVVRPDETVSVIYQLKYFPEGFSGGYAKVRRAQIRKSFTAAMAHNPERWVLVLPRNPTTKERKWVRSLIGKRKLQVAFIGSTQLNILLSTFPQIHKVLTVGPLKEALRYAGAEGLVLDTSAAIDEAATSLGERANMHSAFWSTTVTTGPGGVVGKEFTPLRPDAYEKEPIGLAPTLRDTPEGHEARAALSELRSYGGPSIEIGPDALEAVKITGPEFVAADFAGDVTVKLGPRNLSKPVPCELRILTETGATVRSFRGTSLLSRGEQGWRLVVELDCAVTFTLTTNYDSSQTTADVNYPAATGRDVRHVAEALALMDLPAWQDKGVMAIWSEGKKLFAWNYPIEEASTTTSDPYTRQLVDDLVTIATHYNVALSMPDELTWAQRTEIRKCRLVVEGHVIEEPDFGQLHVTLSGETSAKFEEQLLQDQMAISIETEVQYLVLDHVLPVRAVLFHTRAHAQDGQLAVDVLRTGSGAGHKLTFAGVDGSPFKLYSADESRRDPNVPLMATPLELAAPDDEARDGA